MSETKREANESEAIFYNDWVDCLCAHYLYTQQQGDTANTLGLRRVLLEAGVDEAFIDSLVALPPAAPDVTTGAETPETARFLQAQAPPTTGHEPINAAAQTAMALDVGTFMPTAEAVKEVSPEAPTLSTEMTHLPSAEPALTSDYPAGVKATKRGKRPPQPTLF